jgi:hypothetical protein
MMIHHEKPVATKKAYAKPAFLALPGEILNPIYELALTTHHKRLLFFCKTPQTTTAPKRRPASNQLKHIYHKLHDKTADLKLRYNSIRANYPRDLNTLLALCTAKQRAWMDFSPTLHYTTLQSTRRHNTLAMKTTLHQAD